MKIGIDKNTKKAGSIMTENILCPTNKLQMVKVNWKQKKDLNNIEFMAIEIFANGSNKIDLF
jgi:hypothetical protein